MNDPQRLLDEGATELELSLLRAGDEEGPSPAARRAAAASLGLGVALTTSASLAGAAAEGAPVAASKLLAAKWWLIGALATAGAGLGYVALDAPNGAPRVEASPPLAPAPRIPPRPEPPAPEPAPSPLPEAPAPAVPEPARARAPRAPASAAPGIQDQITLIDRARSAAASGQPGSTLAALDEYQRRFPRGVLQQEAAMLRIEALMARGDRAAASRLGAEFLRQYPRSALAARVRKLLDG